MHGDDVGAERVDVEQAENVVRHFLEAQPGVAEHLERGAIAIAQVSETLGRWATRMTAGSISKTVQVWSGCA